MRSTCHSVSYIVALAAALIATSVRAAPELGGELRMQMGAGGDKIATVTYSDGSKSDLTLGTYFTMAIGGAVTPFSFGPHALDFEALVGWASWSTGPENTDDRMKLGRVPLELLGFYRLRLPSASPLELRLGGGAAYQLVGSVVGTGSLERVSMDVDNALGWVAEARLVWGVLAGGLRYTKMDYRVAGSSLDASSVGVVLGVVFPAIAPTAPAPAARPAATGSN